MNINCMLRMNINCMHNTYDVYLTYCLWSCSMHKCMNINYCMHIHIMFNIMSIYLYDDGSVEGLWPDHGEMGRVHKHFTN